MSLDFAVAQADDHESFRNTQPWTAPPIAAYCTAGDVLCALVLHYLIDVSVALQNRENVMLFKKVEDLRRVGDG